MSAGLSDRFNILQQSPHDAQQGLSPDTNGHDRQTHWVASRYNIRAVSDDGHMVLWNTLSGAISVFDPEQTELITPVLNKKGVEARERGLVRYLVERGFLIPEGSNEYRQFQMKFSRQQFRTDVLQLTIMPSEDCNFRCNYCYEDFARGTMLPEVRTGIKKLVEERAPRLERLIVSWFGGEPLYGWEAIEDLAPFFFDTVREYGLYYSGNMTTNGYLLTPDRAEKLISWGVNTYQITIDGKPQDHDRSRPGRDGSSTFWQIFENLRDLAETSADFSVTVRVNVDKNNFEGIPDFLDLMQKTLENDPRFILDFQPVNQWGGPNDQNLDVCGTSTETVLRDLQEAATQRGFNVGALKISHRFGENVCYAARPYQFLIGAHGQVMKCTILLDKDEANVVGQLTPDGVLELNDERMALWTEPAFERDTQCQKCVLLPNCAGAYCPLPRIQEEGKKCLPERSAPKRALLNMLDSSEKRVQSVAGAE